MNFLRIFSLDFLMNFEYPSYWFEQFFLSGGIYDFECFIWPKNIHSELWKFGIWFSTLWIGFINFIGYAAYHGTTKALQISGSKSRDRNWIDLIMWPLSCFKLGFDRDDYCFLSHFVVALPKSPILEVNGGHVTNHVTGLVIIGLLIWLQVLWLVTFLKKCSKKFQIFTRGHFDHFKTDTGLNLPRIQFTLQQITTSTL